MTSKWKKVFFLLPLLPLLAWLLWPLGSEEFQIAFDQKKIAATKAFLDLEHQHNDTLKRPNIIVIVADDLGQTDISLYGSQLIQTPNIDAIGQTGVTFQEGYTASPICSPSRAALLTGRYQHRFGYEFQPHEIYLKNRLQYYGFRYLVNSSPWNPVYMTKVPKKKDRIQQGLPPSEITLAELLSKEGYATAFIGKWHLGAADFALPCNRGFDYSYGFYHSHSLFAPEDAAWIVNQHIKEDWTDDYIWESQRNGPSAIYRNCELVQDTGYFTQRIAEEAVQFIEKHQKDPFFLYLPFNAPHTPLQAPKSYYDQFSHIEDPIKRIYLAMIASLDDAVGAIQEKITELALDEETLIFFVSDNGGATYTLTTDNAPFKGGKITNFEGGIRVPFMMKWPGHIPPNKVFQHPVSAIDIFITSAAVAHARLPNDRIFDGANLLPFVTDSLIQPPHQQLCWQMGIAKAVRQGDWKLLLNDLQKDTLLYNMVADPYEKVNLKDQHPEIIQQLLAAHQAWASQMAPPLWPGMIYFEHKDASGRYIFDD